MCPEDVLNPTLNELIETDTLKWIFVGGKGGVGKTTTSSSLAILLAKRRESVLILSTDPAHNLSDALSQKFSSQPTLVNNFTNLYAMEVDPEDRTSSHFKSSEFSDSQNEFSRLIPDLVATFPGIDEALSFAELMNSIRTMNFSVIVFDTAPTGHTLRLIGFPELLEKYLSKIVTFREKVTGALNMMSNFAGDMIDTEDFQNKFDSIKALTSSVKSNLQDPTKTTFVCVCIPEFLSVYETERLVQELAKHQIDSSNIVVNQVLFPITEADSIDLSETSDLEAPESFTSNEKKLYHLLKQSIKKCALLESNFIARRKMQSKYLQQIQDLYGTDFHVVAMPLQPEEVRGTEKLEHFGKMLLEPRHLPILKKNN